MSDYSPPIQSQFVRKLLNGDTTFTLEISPPIAGSSTALLEKIEPLELQIDAVNITDAAGANVAMSNIAASAILAARDTDVILQMNCRDKNRIGLMNDLLGAAALGVHNIIALRGDDPGHGDHPNAQAVFDLKSHELIRTAHEMSSTGVVPARTMKMEAGGIQSNRKEIIDPPQFFIGTIDVPSLAGGEAWASRLHRKVAAGVQFVQTQSILDVSHIKQYVTLLEEQGLAENLFVVVSVSPLVSFQSALWVKENVWGVEIPEEIFTRLKQASDPIEEGINICTEQMSEFLTLPGVSGINFIERENLDSIAQVLANIDAQNVSSKASA